MDILDKQILKELMDNGRVTLAELSEKLGLSSPSLSERMKKLERQGIIKGFAAIVDPEKIGFHLLAFIEVTLEKPSHRHSFLAMVGNTEEITECHHTAGDFDYLLKVRCRNTAHLETLISDRIKSVEGVVRTRTNIVLSTIKETPSLPVATEASS